MPELYAVSLQRLHPGLCVFSYMLVGCCVCCASAGSSPEFVFLHLAGSSRESCLIPTLLLRAVSEMKAFFDLQVIDDSLCVIFVCLLFILLLHSFTLQR